VTAARPSVVPAADGRIAAIVPAYNKRGYIEPCIASIVAAADADGQVDIVVVDHGSTDGTFEALEAWRGRVRLERHVGGTIAAVRNAGAAIAGGSLLAFVDCDCVVPRDYFVALRRVLRERGCTAAGCEVGVPADGTWVERTWHALHTRGGDGPRHYINSAAFSVAREAFDGIGGFDAALVTGEDTDICLRLGRAGGTLWEAQALRVTHLDNPRTLGAFYRKERWRGIGGLSRTVLRERARASIATLAFAACALLAIGALFVPIAPAARLAVAVALVLAVPAAAVLWRWRQLGRVVAPLQALVLYTVYFAARVAAFVAVARRRTPTS
jgi:GT2 family glycosyltransferase